MLAVLHPHVGTMVENGPEVQRVLEGSSIALCLDTGHLLIGGTDPAVARSQRRVEPIQSLVFGGCKLTRPIDQLITASGLNLTGLKQYYRPGLRASSYTYEGQARRTDRT